MEHGGEMMVAKRKRKDKKSKLTTKFVQTGQSVAYIQTVEKSGKLSKAKPVVITTVRGK